MARFASKADLKRGARKHARAVAANDATAIEAEGRAPKVYRRVSEANPNLSHNEVRRVSREANVRTAQSGLRPSDTSATGYGSPRRDPDFARRAARKAMKLGYKANEALKGGTGVTKETVGALRRAVIRMGSWGVKAAAKGAAAGMPGEIMEPVAADAEKTAGEIRAKLKKGSLARRQKAAERRLRVSSVRSTI
jgi:hypothetical protein